MLFVYNEVAFIVKCKENSYSRALKCVFKLILTERRYGVFYDRIET